MHRALLALGGTAAVVDTKDGDFRQQATKVISLENAYETIVSIIHNPIDSLHPKRQDRHTYYMHTSHVCPAQPPVKSFLRARYSLWARRVAGDVLNAHVRTQAIMCLPVASCLIPCLIPCHIRHTVRKCCSVYSSARTGSSCRSSARPAFTAGIF